MSLTARQRSIHNKNGAKRSSSFKGKRSRKGSEGEFLVTNAPTDLSSIAYPGGAVALAVLLTVRVIGALWGQIHDCDETYNYWEPLHYLVYGSGLQTWEYSPAYAIRSYLPLWLFAVPAKILSFVFTPVTIFYIIRTLLAVLSACAELMFYKAVCHEFGVHVGRVWLGLWAGAAGAACAVGALLPASWSLALTTAATAAWWRRRMPAAILLTAANVLLSWPFTAILGLPIAIDMLILKRQWGVFIKWSVIALIVFLLPAILVDSWHYGRLVIAPWNIVAYNIFTDHGPDLYGVEPWTYYFVNGFLNFNIVWVLGLTCPLLLAACTLLPNAGARPSFCAPYWLSLAPPVLWLAVFIAQPHKEERFLYPIYSMVVLLGAIAVDCVQKLTFFVGSTLFRWRRDRNRHYLAHTAPLWTAVVLLAGLGGLSRYLALYNNYHAPMSILRHLPTDVTTSEETQLVCFGKEWYKSPSSFHLPSDKYEIRFIKSEFKGQMPAPYSKLSNATRLVPAHFNDLNREDNRSYVSAGRCSYLVDSDVSAASPLQPHYHEAAPWRVLTSLPVLQPSRSHPLLRAFYVPVLSPRYNHYANMYLLMNTDLVTA